MKLNLFIFAHIIRLIRKDFINTFKEADITNYCLKPNDEFYILINSLEEEAANLLSYAYQQPLYVGSIQLYGASLLSQTIDKDGYLLLPVIGKILVRIIQYQKHPRF
jgi:protein involved in polysaccharide export with SLBB domain